MRTAPHTCRTAPILIVWIGAQVPHFGFRSARCVLSAVPRAFCAAHRFILPFAVYAPGSAPYCSFSTPPLRFAAFCTPVQFHYTFCWFYTVLDLLDLLGSDLLSTLDSTVTQSTFACRFAVTPFTIVHVSPRCYAILHGVPFSRGLFLRLPLLFLPPFRYTWMRFGFAPHLRFIPPFYLPCVLHCYTYTAHFTIRSFSLPISRLHQLLCALLLRWLPPSGLTVRPRICMRRICLRLRHISAVCWFRSAHTAFV